MYEKQTLCMKYLLVISKINNILNQIRFKKTNIRLYC